jgi:hypothetical protein
MFGPRKPVDYTKYTTGKTHAQYAKLAKEYGFNDVCECKTEWGEFETQYREGSGTPGMLECTDCYCLVHPFLYVYECDECMEPTVPDKYTYRQDETFLCDDCIMEKLNSA